MGRCPRTYYTSLQHIILIHIPQHQNHSHLQQTLNPTNQTTTSISPSTKTQTLNPTLPKPHIPNKNPSTHLQPKSLQNFTAERGMGEGIQTQRTEIVIWQWERQTCSVEVERGASSSSSSSRWEVGRDSFCCVLVPCKWLKLSGKCKETNLILKRWTNSHPSALFQRRWFYSLCIEALPSHCVMWCCYQRGTWDFLLFKDKYIYIYLGCYT